MSDDPRPPAVDERGAVPAPSVDAGALPGMDAGAQAGADVAVPSDADAGVRPVTEPDVPPGQDLDPPPSPAQDLTAPVPDPLAQPPALHRTPPPASAARRRVYQSSTWVDLGLPPAAGQGTAATGTAATSAAAFWGGDGLDVASRSGVTDLSLVWPLQVLLAVPLACGAAVAAGLCVYLAGLALTVGDPGLSPPLLWAGVGASLVVACLTVLGWVAGLRAERRSLLGLVVAIVAALCCVGAVVLMVLGYVVVPAFAAAVLLGWAAVTAGLRLAFPAAPSVQAGAFSGPALAAGVLGALVAGAAALAVGFAAFSLATISFVRGQVDYGWQATLLSRALDLSTPGAIGRVATLVFANLGLGALFALLLYAGARALGLWRGPLFLRWAIVLGVLVLAGAAAWILDPAIPHPW